MATQDITAADSVDNSEISDQVDETVDLQKVLRSTEGKQQRRFVKVTVNSNVQVWLPI